MSSGQLNLLCIAYGRHETTGRCRAAYGRPERPNAPPPASVLLYSLPLLFVASLQMGLAAGVSAGHM